MFGKKLSSRHEVWLIEWTDAFDAPSAWTQVSDLTSALEVRNVQSVGFLAHGALDGHTVLFTNDDGEGNVSTGIVVPNDMVVRRVRLC